MVAFLKTRLGIAVLMLSLLLQSSLAVMSFDNHRLEEPQWSGSPHAALVDEASHGHSMAVGHACDHCNEMGHSDCSVCHFAHSVGITNHLRIDLGSSGPDRFVTQLLSGLPSAVLAPPERPNWS